MSAGFPFPGPKEAPAYQLRATLWVFGFVDLRVLKERRISSHHHLAPNLCGVPSERIRFAIPVPRVAPWAGMRRPFGA